MQVHQVGGTAYDSNIYLVVEDETALLIDAGTGTSHQRIRSSIENALDARPLDTLVLTHAHFDHTGGAAKLQTAFDLTVLIHPTDAEPVEEGDSMRTGAFLFGAQMDRVSVETLDIEAPLTVGSLQFELYHTPGHSPGSVSLYHRPTQSLFCGDVVFANGGVGRWDLPGGDRAVLEQSIRQLQKLDVANLYTGHGPYIEGDGAAHVKWALDSLTGGPF